MKKAGENGTTEHQTLAEVAETGLQIRWIETDLQRVLLSQNDTLVVFSPHPLRDDTRAHIEEVLHTQFPGHRCLVLDDGFRLGILSTEATS